MGKYVQKRLLQLIPILLGVSFITFALMYIAPSDPAEMKLSAQGIAVSQEILDETRVEMGLNKPFIEQYLSWLFNLLTGDMGISYVDNTPVADKIVKALPSTIVLALSSMILTLLIAIPLGILSAIKHNQWIDYGIRFFTFKRLKNEAIVTELQSELKAIGIGGEVTVHDNSDFFKAGEFDIGIYSIVTTAVGDPQAFLSGTLGTAGVTNFGHYYNAETDQLLTQLKAEFDSDKRAQLAIEVQQKALDEFAFDNIGFVNMAMYMDANITGLKPHPTDYYQMNAEMDMN